MRVSATHGAVATSGGAAARSGGQHRTTEDRVSQLRLGAFARTRATTRCLTTRADLPRRALRGRGIARTTREQAARTGIRRFDEHACPLVGETIVALRGAAARANATSVRALASPVGIDPDQRPTASPARVAGRRP